MGKSGLGGYMKGSGKERYSKEKDWKRAIRTDQEEAATFRRKGRSTFPHKEGTFLAEEGATQFAKEGRNDFAEQEGAIDFSNFDG
jgi:hypothetical protein